MQETQGCCAAIEISCRLQSKICREVHEKGTRALGKLLLTSRARSSMVSTSIAASALASAARRCANWICSWSRGVSTSAPCANSPPDPASSHIHFNVYRTALFWPLSSVALALHKALLCTKVAPTQGQPDKRWLDAAGLHVVCQQALSQTAVQSHPMPPHEKHSHHCVSRLHEVALLCLIVMRVGKSTCQMQDTAKMLVRTVTGLGK